MEDHDYAAEESLDLFLDLKEEAVTRGFPSVEDMLEWDEDMSYSLLPC